MTSQHLLSLFFIVFIYGGLREYTRIRKGYYKWLKKLTQRKKHLYILGRSAFIYTAFLLTQLELSTSLQSAEFWKKYYLYLSIIIAEESGSFIFSKLKIKPIEYALTSMIPGFLITVIFLILQLPLMIM